MIDRVLKVFFILPVLILIVVLCKAQSIHFGLPGVQNFSRNDYHGGIQSWSFGETENGLLYFANNSGLLEYDGAHWLIYSSIGAINRSVLTDGNRVYVGAFNEFGYYDENNNGNLEYHSLTKLIKGRIGDFDEIWRIHKTSFGVVFQSFKAMFIYKDEKLDIVFPRSNFHFSYYVNGVLWVYDEEQGLMQYRDGKVRTITGGDFFKGKQIYTILPLNDDDILIGTSKNGVFRYNGNKVTEWKSEVSVDLKKYQIYSAKRLKNNFFAFGTIQNGLIVTDTAGNLIFKINKERGILNNTVLAIGQDKRGNIWLCLDNGISMVEFDSPVSYLQHYFDIGTGYASARFGEYIYFGTNQGLFYIPWITFKDPSKVKNNFKLIEGTEGQVWNLSVIDNTLFCGHNNGVFQIKGTQAIKISSIQGAWNFLKLDKRGIVLVGSYTGLSILERKNENWHFRNTVSGYKESSRFLQKDQFGNIWVSHTYKGIYRINLNQDFSSVTRIKLFTSKNGLPSDQSNFLFKIQSDLLIASIRGLYKFNYKTEVFEREKRFDEYLSKDQQIDFLHQDSGNNIWYYANRQPGVLRLQEDGTYNNIKSPFSKLSSYTLPSFEFIYELDIKNVLLGIEGGFAHYISKYNKDYLFPCSIYINDLRSQDTTEGIYRYNSLIVKQNLIPKFKFKNNTISISYAATSSESSEINFQHKLLGFDEEWSDWTTQKFKEYTNLPYGDYQFVLRARSSDQEPPSSLFYKFEVLPPWYLSWYAWSVYFVVLLVVIIIGRRYFLFRIEKSRLLEKQKQKEKYLNREQLLKEEALIAEKEMEQLRNEKMNLEMIHKEKELANSTMQLIRKNNTLNKLKTELRATIASTSDTSVKNNMGSLIKRIDKEIDNEKQWQVFNMHVEQVYEELFKKLKDQYPDLTPRELSLCAYLRMNISSKEIATLMNISARGVEISRYRIRKKLHLERDANLTEFMINL